MKTNLNIFHNYLSKIIKTGEEINIRILNFFVRLANNPETFLVLNSLFQ